MSKQCETTIVEHAFLTSAGKNAKVLPKLIVLTCVDEKGKVRTKGVGKIHTIASSANRHAIALHLE